jgi:hypothetical protein
MKERTISASNGYAATVTEEDGVVYKGFKQNLQPAMDHVKKVRDMHDYATKASNPSEWKHIGTVPIVLITDWLLHNTPGYRMEHFARNVDGCKDRFLKYFMSREFSKLHNEHVTTKRESSQIVVPDNYIGSK